MRKHTLLVSAVGVALSLACGSSSSDDKADSGFPDTDTEASGWSVTSHPCVGNRTDTLLLDDASTGYVGCGSTTTGTGLYATTDGGRSWAAPDTDPTGFLETFRVSNLSRGDDGWLYIAGTGDDSVRVLRADTSAEPWVLEAVRTAKGQTWSSFQVGSFARTSDGFAVAESLTGADVSYRDDDDSEWQDGYGWWSDVDSGGLQILDMVTHDDQIYGCGSTITQPPYVFLPPRDSDGFGFEAIALSEEGLGQITGELWGIHVDDEGVLVGGVDQDRDVGVAFRSGDDPYDAGDWEEIDVSTLIDSDDSTWIRGVCRSPSAGFALLVGEYSARSEGLVLRADDGGAFTDITASVGGDLPPLHRCQILDDGTAFIAGADGVFAKQVP